MRCLNHRARRMNLSERSPQYAIFDPVLLVKEISTDTIKVKSNHNAFNSTLFLANSLVELTEVGDPIIDRLCKLTADATYTTDTDGFIIYTLPVSISTDTISNKGRIWTTNYKSYDITSEVALDTGFAVGMNFLPCWLGYPLTDLVSYIMPSIFVESVNPSATLTAKLYITLGTGEVLLQTKTVVTSSSGAPHYCAARIDFDPFVFDNTSAAVGSSVLRVTLQSDDSGDTAVNAMVDIFDMDAVNVGDVRGDAPINGETLLRLGVGSVYYNPPE